MSSRRALIILGSVYHDFEGFAAYVTPLLEAAGFEVQSTYDMDELLVLSQRGYDLVVSYTDFGRADTGRTRLGAAFLTEAQAQAWTDWVRTGGRVLGVHCATVWGTQENPIQKALLGARFLQHPPQFSFMVYPVLPAHPITEGVEAFAVKDEFYMQEFEPGLDVHMVAIDRGLVYPMVWSRREGAGRVAIIAMGHSGQVWNLPPYVKLVTQAVSWLMS
jgi:type 1 glutamine amidotransferase